MVIPRSFSSFALSIWSKGVKGLRSGYLSCSTLVIAAVRVVLPWSMCPMVPMFTCGFVRSNLAFATGSLLVASSAVCGRLRTDWGPAESGLLAPRLRDDLLRDVPGNLGVGVELHAEHSPALGLASQIT